MDVADSPALELAALLRRREVSCEELVSMYLARIERKDPALAAFVAVFRDEALRDAKTKDQALARRSRPTLAPFFGVPTAVKDLNLVAGQRARFGSRGARVTWSPIDDRMTSRLRASGFVLLGKLATSEYGVMPVTEPDIHPPTANPWSTAHSAGGSSGGSGAAVAAGLVPIAQGSDGAGSVRIPAAFCHLYGLKPSRGRVRNAFGFPDETLLYTDGPLAHTVLDAAAMLDAMAGVTVGKPHWAPPPPRPFQELALEAPRKLLVRFTVKSDVADVTPAAREHVLGVARLLERLGHEVEELPGTPGLTLESFLPLWQKLTADAPLVRWRDTQPVTRWIAEAGRDRTKAEVEVLRLELERALLAWQGEADVVLTPTVAGPPPRLGLARTDEPPAQIFAKAAELGAFTAAANITGQPAASVPVGLTDDGLPLGVQLIGRRYADGTVLALSKVLEDELPWRGRRAPLARS